jgi:transcriptional regulator GlxA family with amidase domain
MDELTDWSVDLALVETLFNPSFYEVLPEKQSVTEIIAHTDTFLLNLLPKLYGSDTKIIHAVDLICFAKGQRSLEKVASDVCMCQRHFERKFKSAIGLSPKTFAKITRFKHALQCLRVHPRQDLLSIAVQCGYYDHTHLIKDFKSLSGDAPADFRNKFGQYPPSDSGDVPPNRQIMIH